MAEARKNPSFGGYDDEFVNPIEEDLQCAICQFPLKDPMLTKCGHRFCKQCLDEEFKRRPMICRSFGYCDRRQLRCPVDRNILIRDKDIFPDKATERKILSFIIKCPSKGCHWKGELRSKNNHLSKCPLKVVSCTNKNCYVTLTRNKLQEHVTTTCSWRILRCTHCSVSHPECKTKAHQTECKRFPLSCPQSCGAVIRREEIKRRELENHLQTAVRLHLDMACVKLSATEVRLTKTEVDLTNAREEFKAMTGKLEEKFQEATRKLEEKVHVAEKMMQFSEDRYYKWKISDFSEVLRKAKAGEKTVIYSEPFYRYGYKCRLCCDPNGFHTAKNTHLSAFFQIIKGENDETLPWPFQKKVTLTLIDQQEDVNNRENIVMPMSVNPEKIEFQKPVTNFNPPLGWCKFVLHSKLRERRYIVDDTIFLQAQVAPLH